MTVFHGTKHDDDLNGTSGDDTFDLYKGGEDTAHGGAGDDVFNMGASLDAGDRLDGGADRDTVMLHGDYSAGLVLQDQTIQNIEVVRLGAGFDYNLTLADGNVAAGDKLSINASRLGAGNHLIFDGSAETDGHYVIAGGAGDDTITGGAKSDIFHLEKGGNDTVHGGGGGDAFLMGGAFTAADQIDGGAGNDTLSLDGTYASPITVSGTMVQNVETVTLAGSGYNIAWQSAIASTLTVDASAIGSGNSVLFDSTSLATGNVHFIAGAGDTVFRGGGGDDTVDLQNSADGYSVSGGGGDDTVNFGAGFGAGLPIFDLADGNTGSNTATFNGDYSGGLTLGIQAFAIFSFGLTDFQTVKLLGDHSYTVTFDDSQVGGATLTGGAALTVDASALGAGDHADLDFSLSAAPSFTVTGSAGDDTVTFAANFTAGDAVNGGAGSDTLELKGDYSAGLTFGATTITNVETLKLDDGFSYKLTTNDGNVATSATMTVDASALTGTNALTFDASAENGGFFAITGGTGADTVKFGSNFSASDTVNGGAGTDTLELNGTYTNYTFAANQLTGIDTLKLDAGHIYFFHWNDTDLASGQTLTVDFSALTSGSVSFGGSAEQDGNFHFIAGNVGGTTLIGGAGNDTFDMTHFGNGTMTLDGGGGNDTFLFGANYSAGSINVGFTGGDGDDTIELNGDYASVLIGVDVSFVETIRFDGGHSYGNVQIAEQNISGASVTVDASQIGTLFHLVFEDSALTVKVGSGGMDAAPDPLSLSTNFNDTFIVTSEAAMTASTIDAGDGTDTLELNGDFSGGVAFGATTIANFENITVEDGHNYNLSSNDANVAAGATLTVDASALTSSFALDFGGGAETNGHFAFIAGAGTDLLSGGSQSDTFDLSRTTTANAFGGGGNDTFTVTSAAMIANGLIDGGTGTNTLVLNGDFSTQTAITASTVENIETLQLQGATHSYNLTFADAITTALTVDASAAANLTFSGAGDTSTAFTITGSAGDDTITGGNKGDTITGGGGADIFSYTSVSQSNTVNGYDTITDLAAADSIHITGGVPTFFAAGNEANYQGSLDNDLTDFFAHLGAGKYGVVTLTGGGDPLEGHVFLVIDGDGQMGYAAGADYVIDITGYGGDPSQIHFT